MMLGAEWALREGLPSVMAAVLQAGNCVPVSVLVQPVFSLVALRCPLVAAPLCIQSQGLTFTHGHFHVPTMCKGHLPLFPPLLFPSRLTWSLTFGKGKLRRKENGQVRFDLQGWWHL